jgi:hypothetical protein
VNALVTVWGNEEPTVPETLTEEDVPCSNEEAEAILGIKLALNPTIQNPIEHFWRHLKDIATANWLFRSVDELLANVRYVLHAQNVPLHPLSLTFSHV